MKVRHITLAILVLLIAVLIVQNTHVVTIKLLFWQISMSGIIMFPLLIQIGFAMGYLACRFGGKRK